MRAQTMMLVAAYFFMAMFAGCSGKGREEPGAGQEEDMVEVETWTLSCLDDDFHESVVRSMANTPYAEVARRCYEKCRKSAQYSIKDMRRQGWEVIEQSDKYSTTCRVPGAGECKCVFRRYHLEREISD